MESDVYPLLTARTQIWHAFRATLDRLTNIMPHEALQDVGAGGAVLVDVDPQLVSAVVRCGAQDCAGNSRFTRP